MTGRQDARKEIAQLAPDIRALQYTPEGQTLLKYLRLQQSVSRIELETASVDELHKLQGRLYAIREIISAITG